MTTNLNDKRSALSASHDVFTQKVREVAEKIEDYTSFGGGALFKTLSVERLVHQKGVSLDVNALVDEWNALSLGERAAALAWAFGLDAIPEGD